MSYSCRYVYILSFGCLICNLNFVFQIIFRQKFHHSDLFIVYIPDDYPTTEIKISVQNIYSLKSGQSIPLQKLGLKLKDNMEPEDTAEKIR